MYSGKLIFSQVMDFMPLHTFRRCVVRYQGNSEPFLGELNETVYALDATTIDLCLSMFPWANFRKSMGAIKLHRLLDLRGSTGLIIKIDGTR
jgi:hypothetical protein